ncbi:hypothetical protein N7481_005757 [Penicillium waksmanii]|uniref:uncharacterized protein n=1 Tax=Penicillium waksmanii TaxID=69791 RepID=UPI002546F849|nr:uncharacterized protein N7481_005757 [Penicillium waksmanii]KAJ5983658.1 hypothetical protein N7481_005757 [Penicillium waksmanii]
MAMSMGMGMGIDMGTVALREPGQNIPQSPPLFFSTVQNPEPRTQNPLDRPSQVPPNGTQTREIRGGSETLVRDARDAGMFGGGTSFRFASLFRTCAIYSALSAPPAALLQFCFVGLRDQPTPDSRTLSATGSAKRHRWFSHGCQGLLRGLGTNERTIGTIGHWPTVPRVCGQEGQPFRYPHC